MGGKKIIIPLIGFYFSGMPLLYQLIGEKVDLNDEEQAFSAWWLGLDDTRSLKNIIFQTPCI